jgi:DNA-binding winged helix-turn-helix (wHTH) protein
VTLTRHPSWLPGLRRAEADHQGRAVRPALAAPVGLLGVVGLDLVEDHEPVERAGGVHLRALSRRGNQARSAQIEIGDLHIDLLSRRVRRGQRPVELSSREFALLEYLMRRPGQVLSREQILSAIWDYAFEPGSNVVDVYISYLRRKLDRPTEPSMITTVRGVGYRFEPAISVAAPPSE